MNNLNNERIIQSAVRMSVAKNKAFKLALVMEGKTAQEVLEAAVDEFIRAAGVKIEIDNNE